MFVDTSAIVAIIAEEPDARQFAEALGNAAGSRTSPLVILEAAMVLSSRLNVEPGRSLDHVMTLLRDASVEIAPIEAEHAVLAVQAFATYGKGRHPAALNLADCLSYACAKQAGLPILYKGSDFALTDAKLSG